MERQGPVIEHGHGEVRKTKKDIPKQHPHDRTYQEYAGYLMVSPHRRDYQVKRTTNKIHSRAVMNETDKEGRTPRRTATDLTQFLVVGWPKKHLDKTKMLWIRTSRLWMKRSCPSARRS